MPVIAGVIGCGNISRFHFPALEKAGATIRWVCDTNAEAARPWCNRCGARYTPDYREVLADPEVRLVDITTPTVLHRQMCSAAIAAGKAVVCEKTLAENAGDAAAIVQLAESAGTIFYTSYMKRFIPAVEKARELLPELGRILSTYVRAHQCWGDLWTAAPESGFFCTPPGGGPSPLRRRYGGGILVCGGSHMLDLVLFFLGRPVRVSASVDTPEGRDYDLRAAALLETRHGGVLFEALAHPLNHIGFLRDGWDERIEINGVRGRLEILSAKWDEAGAKASRLIHYDNETGRSVEYHYPAVSPFERALAFFCGNIARGEQGAQPRTTGYEVDELIETMLRSARLGKTLEVEWRL